MTKLTPKWLLALFVVLGVIAATLFGTWVRAEWGRKALATATEVWHFCHDRSKSASECRPLFLEAYHQGLSDGQTAAIMGAAVAFGASALLGWAAYRMASRRVQR